MKQSNAFTDRFKRLIAIIVFAVIAGSGMVALADNGNTGLEPILQTGRKWAFESWVPGDPDFYPYARRYTMEVAGDSIMSDGRIVKVITYDGKVNAIGYENEEGVFVKEEPIDGVEQEFLKIITFNANIGDYFLPGPVSRIENVTFLNHTRKVVFFDFTRYDYPVYWIEGIGSPTCRYMQLGRHPVPPGEHLRVTECWQDDELIYSMEAFNVANSMKELADVLQTNDGPVYDLF
ncbi:MAG: hypothetical protein HDT02_05545, partial [Bacteroidales bacterium]|nr:hypothetical protein [Bacteroidales bacterium]